MRAISISRGWTWDQHVWRIYGRPRRRSYVFLFFVCVFVRLRITPPRIKLAASNFVLRLIVLRLIGVLGRECPILENFAPSEAQNRKNRRAAASIADRCQSPPLTASARGTARYALCICGYTAVPEDGRTCTCLEYIC